MALIVCEECGKQFSTRAAVCPNCGCPNENLNNQILVTGGPIQRCEDPMEQDRTSWEETVKHLKYAKELETTIYTLNTADQQLQDKINRLGRHRKIYPPSKIEYDFPFWATFFITFFVLLLLACAIIEKSVLDIILILTIIPLIFGSSYLLVDLGIAFGGAIAICAVSGIIYVIKKKNQHRKLVKEYRDEISADNDRVQKERKEIAILEQQQASFRQERYKNDLLLKKLYALDVLYPKYRHMVAVVTILEYFESGRCNKLKGSHGAYDTYAYEEKQNIIIGKLDNVIQLLNDIRENQYMLYDAIQSANATARQICAQSEKIVESNGKIAENTALMAYNTSVIRRNTEISAYIDVFRW